jgi:phosphoribosylanthranilate isomerase
MNRSQKAQLPNRSKNKFLNLKTCCFCEIYDFCENSGFSVFKRILKLSFFVKICGITSDNDAVDALGAGADYLGFIGVENTPRFVSPSEFLFIKKQLPEETKLVIVVKNFADCLKYDTDFVQFYELGSEKGFENEGKKLLPVLRPRLDSDLDIIIQKLPKKREYIIIDTYSEKRLGGGGIVGDWSLAKKAQDMLGEKIILAGGLLVENVVDAVNQVCPAGVDVSSGVEEKLRHKSRLKMIQFVNSVKVQS